MARPCESGNGVTGVTKPSCFQTFQNKIKTARLSRPTWRRRNLKKVFQGFLDPGGYGATRETVRPQVFQGFRDRGGDGATFQTEVEMARPELSSSRLRWIQCDFPDWGGDGATKIIFLATEVDTARLSRPKWRRRDQNSIPRDWGGYGATFQTEVETARPRLFSSRLRWIWCNFSDQGGDKPCAVFERFF